MGTPVEGAARGGGIDFGGDVPKQFLAQFFVHLKQAVAAEQDARRQQEYAERVYESGFRDVLARRAAQWADKAAEGHPRAAELQAGVQDSISQLVDYFMIRHCADLNAIQLPEAILRYQDVSPSQIDLLQMILDYLDFAREKETVYTDFLLMPVEKLKNASQAFLFPAKTERIFLICDQSLFGSCREGFALTEKALYWKAHLEPARAVRYAELSEAKRVENWIVIDSYFFNTNPRLNLKMMKLLYKLRSF